MVEFIEQVCFLPDLSAIVVDHGLFNLNGLVGVVTEYSKVLDDINEGATKGVLFIEQKLVCFWNIPGIEV